MTDYMDLMKRADSAYHDVAQTHLHEYEPATDGGFAREQPDDGPTGPIVFSHPTPRKQLITQGMVVTFRKSERTTGETWWRKKRTGPKEGDVIVRHLRECDPRDSGVLGRCVQFSGFASVEDWREAIYDINDGLPERGHLYEATVIHPDG